MGARGEAVQRCKCGEAACKGAKVGDKVSGGGRGRGVRPARPRGSNRMTGPIIPTKRQTDATESRPYLKARKSAN